MSSATKSHADAETAPDLKSLARDFAAMKHDLAAIVAQFKSDAGNGASAAVHDVAGHLGERATHVYETLTAQGKRSVQAVSHQVEEQPLISVLVAFAAGFAASKLLSR